MYHEMSLAQLFQQVMERIGAVSGQQSTAMIVVVGLNLILFGIGLSALGAKLARTSFASILLIAGGVAGAVIGQNAGMSMALSAGIGSVAGLVLGMVVFRLWVGVAAAVLFAAIGTGWMGFSQIWPTAREFDHASYFQEPVARAMIDSADLDAIIADGGRLSPDLGSVPISTKDINIDKHRVMESLKGWGGDLWSYLQSHIGNLNMKLGGLAAGTGLLGLVIGLLFPRFTIVVTTSALGTILLVSGLGVCARAAQPEAYTAAIGNPAIMGAVIGALFTGSMILQGLLSRKGKSEKLVAIPTA